MESDNPLRVLVVDDDPTHSNILQQKLTACNYKGTICNTVQAAIDLLQEDVFDLLISDFNLSKAEGFKLLEQAVQEMKIPVITMSVDGDTSKVMQGVNLLQQCMLEGIQGQVKPPGVQVGDGKKRKDDREAEADSCSDTPSSSAKKARVVWTPDLHQQFVQAVDQIGVNKAGPKRILDLMGDQTLTRENVASHLQKYRQFVSKKQPEKKVKADHASGGERLQDGSNTLQHNVVTNGMFPMSSYANANVYLPRINSASSISFMGQHDFEYENKPHFQQFDNLAARPPTPLPGGYDGVGGGAIVSGLSMEDQKPRVVGEEINKADIYSMWNQNLWSFGCSETDTDVIDVFAEADPLKMFDTLKFDRDPGALSEYLGLN